MNFGGQERTKQDVILEDRKGLMKLLLRTGQGLRRIGHNYGGKDYGGKERMMVERKR